MTTHMNTPTTVTMATTTTSTTYTSRTWTMVSPISGKLSPPLLNLTTTTTSTMTMDSYTRYPNMKSREKNTSMGSSTQTWEYMGAKKQDMSSRSSRRRGRG